METLGIAILVVGVLVSVIGGLMFLVAAFRESVLWGLGVMFVPFVWLIFLVTHWNEAKKPFLINVLGGVVALAGVFAMGTEGLVGAMGGLDAGVQGPSASFESDLGGLDSIGAEDNILADEPGTAAGDDRTVAAAEPEAEAEPSILEDEAGGVEDGGGFGGELADTAEDPADSGEFAADFSAPYRSRPSARAPESRSAEPSGRLTPGRPRFTTLTVESAANYIGQRVRIVKKNGKVLTGRLIKADELRLTIEERMGGGTMSYPVRKSDVEKIELVGRR